MFYTYRQNNSGGHFIGPVYVCVECDSTNEADEIAQNHGVYFNGCSNGQDCDCCGDRWSRAWDDLTEQPEVYGEFLPDQLETYIIVYKDGRVISGGSRNGRWR
jgi:hypothetical protein